ncbi:MAG: hypothetical protein DHS20C13_13080 [Thermodesulfobacteriota bacterium]|nr:MAG: hypothetical protein DHS20C13_13080 [Thermodesulfobacteriota bacterium]
MRSDINRVVLVIFVVLLGIGGFYTIGQSQDKSATEPRVTIIGDPAELPQRIKNDLPTGYSSRSSESVNIPDSRASDENDPTIVFVINPRNPNISMKEQMEYAQSKGKKEVFFKILEFDPDAETRPVTLDDLVETVKGLDLYSIDFSDIIFDFVNTPAYANSVQGSNCGGSTVPSGTCNTATFTDDDSSDGKIPGFEVCVEYVAFSCHLNSIFDHLKKNVAISSTVSCSHTSSNGSDCPWVDCMKAHNGSSFIKAPVDLTVLMYFNASDIKNNFGCANTPNICGCSFIGTLSNPRRSVDVTMAMNGQNSCHWLENMKHELAHTYGYDHIAGQQDYANNRDNIKHCIKNHHIH